MRQQTKELEEELAKVQQDYNQKMSSLHQETDRLETLKNSLKYRLMPNQTSTPPSSPPKQDNKIEVQPPPEVLEDTSPKPPPISPEESRRQQRKRILADHVEYFIAESDREPILQLLNAVLHDEKRDLGDMLEQLSWGEIWTLRAEWESGEEQYTRLQEWQQALSERLTYWEGSLRQLETSSAYELWQEKRSRSSQEWLSYLEELAVQQAEENERLAHAVAILEQELQQRELEVNDG